MKNLFKTWQELGVFSHWVKIWKSDLPVQSLPTRSWSFVVWQILTYLQSFAQIPRPPPPPPRHLQLLGTDARCSCTRPDSAGCSRAGGPGGSSHSHTQPLTCRSLAEVDMGQAVMVGCKSCSCLCNCLESRGYASFPNWGDQWSHTQPPSSSFRQFSLTELF